MENIERIRKRSRQREEILAVIRSTREHPTAASIYKAAKRRIPNLSLGTVYRNLVVLEEQGLLRPIRNGHHHDRFDGDTSPHYHLICESCGSVVDLPMNYRPDLDGSAAESGFLIHGHRLDFYGLCPLCAGSKIEKPDGP